MPDQGNAHVRPADRSAETVAACQAMFDRHPGKAWPPGGVDQTMRITTSEGPHDLVRHVFGPGQQVFFRLYPAGAACGTEIAQDVTVSQEVALMLAGATSVQEVTGA